eukprot:8496543-Alexandrium_andersonii.AAC.1
MCNVGPFSSSANVLFEYVVALTYGQSLVRLLLAEKARGFENSQKSWWLDGLPLPGKGPGEGACRA